MEQRIKILDGFRAFAILPVILFHYMTRWTTPFHNESLYPYGSDFDYFLAGRLGVQFFFIISGFVIVYTLENTKNFKEFWIRRFIRLYPTMVIASLLTFGVMYFFDVNNSLSIYAAPQNLISSVTFIPPWNLETITGHSLHFEYVDGAYWSIWYEILFYVLCSTLFFLSRKRFFINFSVVTFFIILAGYFFDTVNATHSFMGYAVNISFMPVQTINSLFTSFPLHRYLVYLQMGYFFYLLYKSKHGDYKPRAGFYIAFLLSVFLFFYLSPVQFIWVFVLFLALFVAFIYYPRSLRIFETRLMVTIGLSSYFLYLIHQNIGVVILDNMKSNKWLFDNLATPLALITVMIVASIFFTENIEKLISRKLRKFFKISYNHSKPSPPGKALVESMEK